MWQKAKYVRHPRNPKLVGAEIWIKCGVPFETSARSISTGVQLESERSVIISMTPRYGPFVVAPIELLELLPEFRDDDPPMIPWQRYWSAE